MTLKPRAEGSEIPAPLIEEQLRERRIAVCESSRVPAVIPNEARATATGFHCGSVAIHIVAGERIAVVEKFGQLGNSEEVEVRRRIINRVGNIVDMFNVSVVDKFQADCALIALTTLARLDSVDLHLHRNQRTGEK